MPYDPLAAADKLLETIIVLPEPEEQGTPEQVGATVTIMLNEDGTALRQMQRQEPSDDVLPALLEVKRAGFQQAPFLCHLKTKNKNVVAGADDAIFLTSSTKQTEEDFAALADDLVSHTTCIVLDNRGGSGLLPSLVEHILRGVHDAAVASSGDEPFVAAYAVAVPAICNPTAPVTMVDLNRSPGGVSPLISGAAGGPDEVYGKIFLRYEADTDDFSLHGANAMYVLPSDLSVTGHASAWMDGLKQLNEREGIKHHAVFTLQYGRQSEDYPKLLVLVVLVDEAFEKISHAVHHPLLQPAAPRGANLPQRPAFNVVQPKGAGGRGRRNDARYPDYLSGIMAVTDLMSELCSSAHAAGRDGSKSVEMRHIVRSNPLPKFMRGSIGPGCKVAWLMLLPSASVSPDLVHKSLDDQRIILGTKGAAASLSQCLSALDRVNKFGIRVTVKELKIATSVVLAKAKRQQARLANADRAAAARLKMELMAQERIMTEAARKRYDIMVAERTIREGIMRTWHTKQVHNVRRLLVDKRKDNMDRRGSRIRPTSAERRPSNPTAKPTAPPPEAVPPHQQRLHAIQQQKRRVAALAAPRSANRPVPPPAVDKEPADKVHVEKVTRSKGPNAATPPPPSTRPGAPGGRPAVQHQPEPARRRSSGGTSSPREATEATAPPPIRKDAPPTTARKDVSPAARKSQGVIRGESKSSPSSSPQQDAPAQREAPQPVVHKSPAPPKKNNGESIAPAAQSLDKNADGKQTRQVQPQQPSASASPSTVSLKATNRTEKSPQRDNTKSNSANATPAQPSIARVPSGAKRDPSANRRSSGGSWGQSELQHATRHLEAQEFMLRTKLDVEYTRGIIACIDAVFEAERRTRRRLLKLLQDDEINLSASSSMRDAPEQHRIETAVATTSSFRRMPADLQQTAPNEIFNLTKVEPVGSPTKVTSRSVTPRSSRSSSRRSSSSSKSSRRSSRSSSRSSGRRTPPASSTASMAKRKSSVHIAATSPSDTPHRKSSLIGDRMLRRKSSQLMQLDSEDTFA